jgi:hypothetical protein
MKVRDHSIETLEEREIRRLWLQRPPRSRNLEELEKFEQWLVARRPDLLPKGSDDAFEYLARLLADCVTEAAVAA